MKRTEIKELYAGMEELGGKTVTVCGWARTIRDSKALGFIDLNDGSCFKGVQIVFEADKLPNYKDHLQRLNVGFCHCCHRRTAPDAGGKATL